MVLFDVYILKGFTKIKYLKMELSMNREMDKIPRWESVRCPRYLKDTFLLWLDDRGVDRGVIGTAGEPRSLPRGRRNSSINQRNITMLPNGVVQAIARARNSSHLLTLSARRALHKNKVNYLGLMIWYKVFHSIPFHPKSGGWIPLEVTFPWKNLM